MGFFNIINLMRHEYVVTDDYLVDLDNRAIREKLLPLEFEYSELSKVKNYVESLVRGKVIEYNYVGLIKTQFDRNKILRIGGTHYDIHYYQGFEKDLWSKHIIFYLAFCYGEYYKIAKDHSIKMILE